ncbi:Hsp70 family protein [Dactylosporangium sp. CA-139066]|uniref:Hsp70 family protein n=1 Tax=Dactylosporangium sp. CA-139066 TaxID=3239930 RepID=UPI003D8A3CF2
MLLGIDFGTTHTAAVLFDPEGAGAPVPLLFDASPLLLSGVHLTADGQLLTGRDTARNALSDPGRSEPNPKLRVDEGTVLLGDAEVQVHALIAAVLGRVHDEAVRHAGAPVGRTVLTHPASWATHRRDVLLRAAEAAGLPGVTLVPEPVAAAAFHARASGRPLPAGATIAVYDLGGGTFDVSVLRRTDAGWAIVATAGLDDVGGIDLDAALAEHIGRTAGAGDARKWRRLVEPVDAAGRRVLRGFRDDVRGAKEQLSRTTSATVRVPLLEVEAYLSREEFEAVAAPPLTRTADLVGAALRQAGVDPRGLTALYLVGGSSRIPLVATMLHQRFGVAPTLVDEPQLVVAAGSVAAAGTPVIAPPAATFAAPPPPPPAPPGGPAAPVAPAASVPPGQAPPPRRRSVPGAAILVAALVAGLLIWHPWTASRGSDDPTQGDGARATATGNPAAVAGPGGKRTFHVDKDAWFAGFQLHIKDAVYDPADADSALVVSVRATNLAHSDEGVDTAVPFSVRFGSGPYNGRYLGSSLTAPAGSYIDATVAFRITEKVDPATGVVVLGANSQRLAKVPFTGAEGLVALQPQPVLSPAQAEMHQLKFTNVQCTAGAAIPERFRQVSDGERSVHCTYDAEYTGTEIGIEAGHDAFRLVRPDNTEVAPTDSKVASLSGGDSLRGLYVTFVLAAGASGAFKLRMRYRGSYTRVTDQRDVPLTVQPD